MSKVSLIAMSVALALDTKWGANPNHAVSNQPKEIGFVKVGRGVTLRRMVWRNPDPQGYVLLLHGFPETVHTWERVAAPLAETYEVHAIDWPGYGLSSRPPAEKFGYAPRDYARVLRDYLARSGIDQSRLTIYATDIGALPALLLALEEPSIARTIIVGDFAPFDRPQHMYPSLQSLKSLETAAQVRAHMNRARDEILANTFFRGLPDGGRFEISEAFNEDMRRGWDAGTMSSADAFYHYYSHFTRDQEHFEARAEKLATPLKVVWGEKDVYISKQMGVEFAERLHTDFTLLPEVGHYPHLQDPQRVADEISAPLR
jgi:pimeloyl-ACP methyl ester carboxylesterase